MINFLNDIGTIDVYSCNWAFLYLLYADDPSIRQMCLLMCRLVRL
jgi:hypothetical protein